MKKKFKLEKAFCKNCSGSSCKNCAGVGYYIPLTYDQADRLAREAFRKLPEILRVGEIVLLPLVRGGVPIAGMIGSYLMRYKMFPINMDEKIGPQIAQINRATAYMKARRLLIVDDIYDTGETLAKVYKYRDNLWTPNTVAVHSFVLLSKQQIHFHVSAYGVYIPKRLNDLWVTFPWETAKDFGLKVI